MNNQRLTQTQRQELKLSPQQIQLMKLLQLPLIELEQRIKEEMEINPALEDVHDNDYDENEPTVDEPADDNGENDDYNDEEVDFSKDDEFDINDYLSEEDREDYSYKLQANNYSDDDDDYEAPIVNEETFQDYLNQQLAYHDLTEDQLEIGQYIIGNLDDNGYLNRPVANIVDDMLFTMNVSTTEEEVSEVLRIVQQLDPPGIAARDLQECLLIQLKRLQEDNPFHKDYSLAMTIVKDFFEEFTKKHYDKIAKKLEVSNRDLKAALDEILKLNPKPADASSSSTKNIHYITPDFFVYVRDGKVELSLDGRNAPELRVSKSYLKMLDEFSNSKDNRSKQEAVQFVKQKIDSAKWFIDAINQRNTLYITMKAIVDIQEEYFLTGDETQLKPMILKDVADKVGLDISTISRVANSKYVQTPYGTHLLKFFFSEGITNEEGEEVSTREIKKILKDAVENEDKASPMTDEQLMFVLKEKGYPIARRTVAKYREQLGIPVGRMRKKI